MPITVLAAADEKVSLGQRLEVIYSKLDTEKFGVLYDLKGKDHACMYKG